MKSIRLENVKAFVDTTNIEIAPITILVGKNSCGKSSFIRFPQVLAQTFLSGVDNPIYLNGTKEDSIDYGNFKEVLHNGEGESFSISLTYPFDYSRINIRRENIGFAVIIPAILHGKSELTIRITYSIPEKRVYATKIELFVDGERLSWFSKVGETKEYVFVQERTIEDGKLTEVFYTYNINALFIQNYMPSFSPMTIAEAIYRQYISSDETISYDELMRIVEYTSSSRTKKKTKKDEGNMVKAQKAYEASIVSNQLFTYVYDLMQQEFLKLKYIGPFRSAPKRYYRVDEIERDEVGVKGDYTSSILINSDEELKKEVSGWFEEAFKSSIRVNPIGEGTGLYTITTVDMKNDNSSEGNNKGVNLMDVGYGFSQVLPIVTQLKKCQIESKMETQRKRGKMQRRNHRLPYSEIIVIEQPELHLHPAAQSKLASLFASAVQDVGENGRRKLLIETHSEHLIRKLQVMIADPNCFLKNEMVKIYYVDKAQHGCSNIVEKKISEEGQFMDDWPSGFFDESYELSRELMRCIYEKNSDGE